MMHSSETKIAGLHLQGRRLAWQSTCRCGSKKGDFGNRATADIQFEFPGWKQISDNRKGIHYKLIWSLIIVSSLLLCGYQITDRIIFFASCPISTEIIVLKNNSVKFPSDIACPNFHFLEKFVPYQKRIAEEKNISHCAVSIAEVVNRFNFSMLKLLSYVEVASLLKEPRFHQWGLQNIYQANSSFVVTDLPVPCGFCKKISFPELIPFRKEAWYLLVGTKDGYTNCAKYRYAFTVYVRPDNDHIKYNPFSDTIEVQHSLSFVYGFSARQFSYINTAKNPCSDRPTVNACQDRCIENHSRKSVVCKLPSFGLESDLPNCTTFAEYYTNAQHVTLVPVLLDYREDCNCPRLCKETVYKLDSKTVMWGRKTEIKFYFDDNQIDFMREYYSYTIIPLLCDLGGNLGLFLGLCIPTVLENIENVVVYLKRKLF